MNELTVIDLDGTYVRCNTLHVYIRCGVRRMLARLRLLRLVKTLSFLVLRKCGLIDHATMKFGISELIDSNDPALRDDFVAIVKSEINTVLAGRLAKENGRVLLATAALDLYVPWIWPGDYVATKTAGNKARLECRGEEKLRRVEEYATGKGLELHDFYTDHVDDLPLIKKSPKVILVNAGESTKQRLEGLGIKFEEI